MSLRSVVHEWTQVKSTSVDLYIHRRSSRVVSWLPASLWSDIHWINPISSPLDRLGAIWSTVPCPLNTFHSSRCRHMPCPCLLTPMTLSRCWHVQHQLPCHSRLIFYTNIPISMIYLAGSQDIITVVCPLYVPRLGRRRPTLYAPCIMTTDHLTG